MAIIWLIVPTLLLNVAMMTYRRAISKITAIPNHFYLITEYGYAVIDWH